MFIWAAHPSAPQKYICYPCSWNWDMDGILEGFPLGVNGGLPPWKQQDESWGLALPLLHFPKGKGVLPYPEPTSLDPSDLGRL